MAGCQRCESLPESLPGEGVLYVAPPEAGVAARIRAAFKSLGLEIRAPYPEVLEVSLGPGHLSQLCQDHFIHFNQLELNDIRCLLLPEGAPLTVQALLQMRPLASLMTLSGGEWFVAMLRDQRLVSFFQPIVRCAAPQEVFAYECLIRGRASDGAIVPPAELFSRARSADLLFQLDRAARITAIRDAKRHGISANIFINFAPTAVYDPSYCLQTTVAAIEQSGIDPDRIVFEVVETEDVGDPDHLLRILDFYRENGYKIALDDLGAGYSSLNLLGRLRPDFMKLDMQLVRNVDADAYKERICANLLDLARGLDIRAIAEGVETPGEWNWLKEHGADFVQGYLFAAPAEEPLIPKVPG